MSKTSEVSNAPRKEFGAGLKSVRLDQNQTLRAAAEATGMDLAHLQKIECGRRLPTLAQVRALAAHYGLDARELEAKLLAERYWRENADNPAALDAIQVMKEIAPAYVVNKSVKSTRTSSNK